MSDEFVGWTRNEYLASPDMARRLHKRILDLEDEIAQLKREKDSYVCEQCGDRYSDHEFTVLREYETALREARWNVSTLQTERDAAIASATMPLRIALREIVNTQPFCPAPSPLLGKTPWEIAKRALEDAEAAA